MAIKTLGNLYYMPFTKFSNHSLPSPYELSESERFFLDLISPNQITLISGGPWITPGPP